MTDPLRSPFSSGFTDSAAADLADAMKTLSNPSRLKIAALLHSRGEMTGSDLAPLLGLSQATACYHLKRLARVGLVSDRTAGQQVPYRLHPAAFAALAWALKPGGAA